MLLEPSCQEPAGQVLQDCPDVPNRSKLAPVPAGQFCEQEGDPGALTKSGVLAQAKQEMEEGAEEYFPAGQPPTTGAQTDFGPQVKSDEAVLYKENRDPHAPPGHGVQVLDPAN